MQPELIYPRRTRFAPLLNEIVIFTLTPFLPESPFGRLPPQERRQTRGFGSYYIYDSINAEKFPYW